MMTYYIIKINIISLPSAPHLIAQNWGVKANDVSRNQTDFNYNNLITEDFNGTF